MVVVVGVGMVVVVVSNVLDVVVDVYVSSHVMFQCWFENICKYSNDDDTKYVHDQINSHTQARTWSNQTI